MAKTFDGPPTLERSGYEHRVGRFPPSSLRFLSPRRGTEGVLKTIEGRFSKRDTRRSQSRIGQNLYKSVQSVGHEKVKKKSASSARP